MNKKIVFLALTVILITGCVTEETGKDSTTTTTAPLKKAGMGDKVYVNYVGKFTNGTIFDTSYEEKAREAGIYDILREYKPLEFTIGEKKVISGFEEAVINMKTGEEKTVRIPPKHAYGEVDPKKIERINRTQSSPRIEDVPREVFVKYVEGEPFPGMVYNTPPYDWDRTVLNVTNSTVTIRHDPGLNATIQTIFGLADVGFDEQYLHVRVNPVTGKTVMTAKGPAKILNVTDDWITLDFNHWLAGKTLIFTLTLEDVTKGR